MKENKRGAVPKNQGESIFWAALYVGNIFNEINLILLLAVGPETVGKVDINAPVIDNLKAVAKAKNKNIEDLVVTILDRERHEKMIQGILDAGALKKLEIFKENGKLKMI